MKKIYIQDTAEWRSWLQANHEKAEEIWLVFYKKETGLPSIPYEDAVEQALCFGWIDSLIKKLDENQYARKFTPRREGSKWSASNKKRVKKMIDSGMMTPHGMKLVESAKRIGTWDKPEKKPDLDFKIHPEFTKALQDNPEAQESFNNLPPTHQKQYITWIGIAKRRDTRERRIKQSIDLLKQGRKLGLK